MRAVLFLWCKVIKCLCMDKNKIRRAVYKFRHDFLTAGNVGLLVVGLVCFYFVWQSISVMTRNYDLQKKVDNMRREALILELETATLEYERNYYKTKEYQELAVREKLGLVNPGESMLKLPANSEEATNRYNNELPQAERVEEKSNFRQWMEFLFGQNNK